MFPGNRALQDKQGNVIPEFHLGQFLKQGSKNWLIDRDPDFHGWWRNAHMAGDPYFIPYINQDTSETSFQDPRMPRPENTCWFTRWFAVQNSSSDFLSEQKLWPGRGRDAVYLLAAQKKWRFGRRSFPLWKPAYFSGDIFAGINSWALFFFCGFGAYTLAPCLHNCFRMPTRNGKGAYAGAFLD